MYFIKLLIYLAFFFILLFVFLQNSVERVNVYLFKYTFEDIHVFWIMFFSFLLGAFFAWLFSAYQEIIYRLNIHKQKKEIENLKEEIHNLRKMMIEETEIKPEEKKEDVTV